MSLPTFDLTPFATGADHHADAATTTAAAIDEALQSVGFLLVTGHGVDDDLHDRYFAAMREFFALPAEAKEAISIDKSDHHRGYVGFGTESLDGAIGGRDDEDAIGTAGAGDLKETLDTGIEYGPGDAEFDAGTPLHGPNQWPDLPGFRATVEEYRAAAIEASDRMHRALAIALGLNADYFIDLAGDTMYHLRLIHYPATDRVPPEPGQFGCGAHTDYGTLTLLATDGVAGLQVRNRSGEWIDATAPPGPLVVNIGDLMAIWTNDRWVSNPHRVVNPPNSERYSSPLFVEPPFHTVIEALPGCVADGEMPRHAPMVAGEYLLSRFDGTHSYRSLDEAGAS